MKKQIMLDVINQLGYDFNHFDLYHFIDHIQRHRRREIILVPADFDHELSALWVRAETADYIFFNTNRHIIHQTHSILHEIAHITLDHQCIPISDVLPPDLLVELHSDGPIGRPRIVKPTLHVTPEEQEAEEFVYIIQREVMNANRIEQLLGQGSSIQKLNKYVEGMAFDD